MFFSLYSSLWNLVLVPRVLKFHKYMLWLGLFLPIELGTWRTISTWKFVISFWEFFLELYHEWCSPLSFWNACYSDVKLSGLFFLHSFLLSYFFIVLSFESIFGEIIQTLFPKPSIEFFISAITFVFYILKVYFCFLSSKIASYSCFMGVTSSLILKIKSWFLPSCFFLFILMFNVHIYFYLFLFFFLCLLC